MFRLFVLALVLLNIAGISAAADLKLGDILVIEPGNAAISAINPSTGARTLITSGGLLDPLHKAVGVALARNGDIVVVHRLSGLIRVNPVSGVQSVLSTGGLFRDPWAVTVDKETGQIFVADSGYDNDRPQINEVGKIIRVDPVTGAQELIATGSACNVFPAGLPCQNTTSAGSYVTHPYGIAIDYTTNPNTIVVADQSSFTGQGAIIRIQPVANGAQTLLWGPASAVPAPQVARVAPLGCPMGVTVAPNGHILTSTFTFPVPSVPVYPPPNGTYYGCAPGAIYRIDLASHVQSVVSANAPARQSNHAYAVGEVVRDQLDGGNVHAVVTAGVSGVSTPPWNNTLQGQTVDGSVVWRNIGFGASWQIPFGIDVEPAPSDPLGYNIIVPDEGFSMIFRLNANGQFSPGGAPLANGLPSVTAVDVIDFTPPGGFGNEPVLSNGQPTGTLPAGTTQTTISVTTGGNVICRYSTVAGTAYDSMPLTFTTTGGTQHSSLVAGLTNGHDYSFFVRCRDQLGHTNTVDFVITFSVANSTGGPPVVNLVAAYHFNEGSGATLTDGSGQNNNGVVSGAAWVAQGKFGGALSFDGVDDWVTVASSSSLNLTTGMTLEAWVFPTAIGTGSWRNVLIKERPGGEVYNLYANTDGNTPRIYAVTGSGLSSINGPGMLALNTWSHLAATYDGAVVRLYVNGVLSGSAPGSGALIASSGVIRLGGNNIWGEFFQGRIDEVRIYNRGLTQSEIVADMSAPIGAGGGGPDPDMTPPARMLGQPIGILPSTTTQVTLSLTTNEAATCRYGTQPNVAYSSMTQTFSTTGGTSQAVVVSGLTSGGSYSYFVRCIDAALNVNTDDFPIAFSIATAAGDTSSFAGTESPLSEGGAWAGVGGWALLSKNNGAFASTVNAAARRVAPAFASNQYSEITYDQNPGLASWVGVLTRVQSASNGSGYLAIVYNGEARLYLANDAGSLNFTLLAQAAADLSTAPRRLRLESEGNMHRVYFNGALVITHNATGTPLFTGGQPGIAASVFGGPQVKILSYQGGSLVGGSDTTAPLRTNGLPSGSLPFGTTQTTLTLTTNENATCKYGTQANVAYASMTQTFSTTGGTAHAVGMAGLLSGTSYQFYVRCADVLGNANTDDFSIAFSVAGSSGTTSTFSGTENPLSENGVWDSPGAWANLRKNNGALADGLNAMARRVTPVNSANQYSQITYDQDPGSASWVGVMTRVQSATNGSGYLAIAYAGEVRLYRADESGSLSFTMLVAASANLAAGPRLLRLESDGNTHRVFFNGALLITHAATGTIYSAGQPGIAASVFGGPQVKILSFEGGSLN